MTSIGFISYAGFELIQGDRPIFERQPDGAICNDGWRSYSQGRGTCSWHGGVDYYLYKYVKVGVHQANPTPYIILGNLSIIIGMLMMYRNVTLRLTIYELLLLLSRLIYFLFQLVISWFLLFLSLSITWIHLILSLIFQAFRKHNNN